MIPPGIVITGLGVVTSLGTDPHETLRRIQAGAPAFVHAQVPGVPGDPPITVAPVTAADPTPYLRDRKSIKYMDRMSRQAVTAAGMALESARLDLNATDPTQIALYMGVDRVSAELADLQPVVAAARAGDGAFDVAGLGKNSRINPMTVFKTLSNIPICNISIGMGLRGDHLIVYSDAVQSAMAMDEGAWTVHEGAARFALVGATAQPVNFLGLHTHGMLHGRRSTRVPADGSAVLVLEDEARARARSAPILARYRGLTVVSTPGRSHHVLTPRPPDPAVIEGVLHEALEHSEAPRNTPLNIIGGAVDAVGRAAEVCAVESLAGRTATVNLVHPWDICGDLGACRTAFGLVLGLVGPPGLVVVLAGDEAGTVAAVVLEVGEA